MVCACVCVCECVCVCVSVYGPIHMQLQVRWMYCEAVRHFPLTYCLWKEVTVTLYMHSLDTFIIDTFHNFLCIYYFILPFTCTHTTTHTHTVSSL